MKRIYIPSHDPIPCELLVDIDDSWISTSRSERILVIQNSKSPSKMDVRLHQKLLGVDISLQVHTHWPLGSWNSN